jgi:hypothetical protein
VSVCLLCGRRRRRSLGHRQRLVGRSWREYER